MRTLDLIKVGDWLLRGGHLTVDEVTELVAAQPWRAGADQPAWVCRWLRGGVRSLPESELRSILVFGGLPEPEVNASDPALCPRHGAR